METTKGNKEGRGGNKKGEEKRRDERDKMKKVMCEKKV